LDYSGQPLFEFFRAAALDPISICLENDQIRRGNRNLGKSSAILEDKLQKIPVVSGCIHLAFKPWQFKSIVV